MIWWLTDCWVDHCRIQGVPVEVGFNDILEKLEFSAMARFEAHHESGWGIALDYGFVDLASDISGPRGGVISSSVKQTVFEGLPLKRRETDSGSMDLFAGIRFWDQKVDVLVDTAILPGTQNLNLSKDWLDIVLGIRWINVINDKWSFVFKGDVGGFGQEADFTSSVEARFQYVMSDNWKLGLGYKSLWVDYEDGTAGVPGYFSYDTSTHGPVIGFNYSF